ncbi:MAG: alpha/beta hydrolase [Lacibacter sp.]
MRSVIFILLLAVVVVSCKKKDADTSGQTILNVQYGTDAKQVMDVYLPANRSVTSTPVVVMIHGGGWQEGDKTDFTPMVDTLKKRLPGYAIINISYRLAANGQNLFPAQENDVKSCIEFIYSKRSEYKISDKYVLIGASAGGHLALLQSYKYTSPVKVKAVISFFGPTELTQMYNNPPNPLIPILLLNVTGTIPSVNAAIYNNSSSYNYAVASSTPTMMLHGGADIVVAPSQSTLLRDKLNSLSVPNQFVYYPNGGHGDWDAATYTDAFTKMTSFIKTYIP